MFAMMTSCTQIGEQPEKEGFGLLTPHPGVRAANGIQGDQRTEYENRSDALYDWRISVIDVEDLVASRSVGIDHSRIVRRWRNASGPVV